MPLSSRRAGAAAALALLLGATAPAFADGVTYRAAATSFVNDPTGDTFDDDEAPVADARADITTASADYRPGEIAFTLRVVQPTNPASDPNWVDGASAVTWVLDTNRDGSGDYLALIVNGGGAVGGVVTNVAAEPAVLCAASSAGLSDGTYAIAFDPACIGNPASFLWGAVTMYDTNPADVAAPVVYDVVPEVAPDAGPVDRPAGAGDGSGYWMISGDGTVYRFDGAQDFGGVATDAADIEPIPSMNGYWILSRTGQVFPRGGAPNLGDAALQPGESATSLSATATGNGYWVFTDRGRVIAKGDAVHYGDMAGVALNAGVLDSVATPSGQGYWMVAGDGGVFTFGDAVYYGSMGATTLNQPVMSMAPDPDGTGYWLVASDGGIFAFEAAFYGSMGATPLNQPVSGMVQGPGGYLMVAEDGGIFAFGNVPFHGSLGASPPPHPVVAVALKPATV